MLTGLHAERFQDRSSAAVQPSLLDEGQHLCSIRTMYRILEHEGESRERRDQSVHRAYQRPDLLATAPNQMLKLDGLRGITATPVYAEMGVFSRFPQVIIKFSVLSIGIARW